MIGFYQDSHEVLCAQSWVPPELGVLVQSEGEVPELKDETSYSLERFSYEHVQQFQKISKDGNVCGMAKFNLKAD